MDQGNSILINMSMTADIIAAVTASMEEDQRLTVRELSSRHGLNVWVVQQILTNYLGLGKKSAFWVPKLLSPAQKTKRVHISDVILKLIQRHSMSILSNIVMMDESAVSFHIPVVEKMLAVPSKGTSPCSQVKADGACLL